LVLMHHEIAPTQGNRAAELLPALGIEMFRAQLEHVGRHYEVVPLRELVKRADERSSGQPLPLALTFDDDLRGHASIAAPILEEFGFPATFFLSGNSLHGPSTFWWQDLQAILNQGTGALSKLQHELAKSWPWAGMEGRLVDLTSTIESLPPEQRDAVAARLHELAGTVPADEGLSAEAVKSISGRGFEIGFHTRRHYQLLTLDDDGLDRAMRDGVEELEELIGYRPIAIGYPHGKADLRVAEAARRAGFELGFKGVHAAASADQHPLLIERVVAWTDSLSSFAWALGRLAAAA
jgi:peptidoglycan/xylan/chitin deacetylase (PgdA/CDA1 family)